MPQTLGLRLVMFIEAAKRRHGIARSRDGTANSVLEAKGVSPGADYRISNDV